MKHIDKMNLLADIIDKASYRAFLQNAEDDEYLFSEMRMDLGDGYGVMLTGNFCGEQEFEFESLIPFVENPGISTYEESSVETRTDGASYAGLCDDLNVGAPIIYRLLNGVEFLRSGAQEIDLIPGVPLSLSGLSVEGTVMLPIYKTEQERRAARDIASRRRRTMSKARQGDQNAMNDLNTEERNTFTILYDRMDQEDLFTLVDTYFIPTGVECDLYSIVAEIRSCEMTVNPITLDQVCVLTLAIDELSFTIAINQKDLLGEPLPGRRFKGIVWLQGILRFPDADLYST
jgi:hypothetical protein